MIGKKSTDTDQWYDIEKAKIYKGFFQNQLSWGKRLTSILTSLNIENGQNFWKFKHFWLCNGNTGELKDFLESSASFNRWFGVERVAVKCISRDLMNYKNERWAVPSKTDVTLSNRLKSRHVWVWSESAVSVKVGNNKVRITITRKLIYLITISVSTKHRNTNYTL